MAQYSENTCHDNGCRRYAEAGCAYADNSNECGLSAKYARFHQGTECSVELTWRRQLNKTIALQPSFQYINNDKQWRLRRALCPYERQFLISFTIFSNVSLGIAPICIVGLPLTGMNRNVGML